MKFMFILVVLFPIFLYSSSIHRVQADIMRIQAGIEKQKRLAEERKIALERQKKFEEAEAEKKAKIKEKRRSRNSNAEKANERYYQEQKHKSKIYNNIGYSSTQTIPRKKQFNPNDFKKQAQLKLGDLHILGIKSIKPFKDNKLIIKAANGTFALPKDKYNQAIKINFNKELIN